MFGFTDIFPLDVAGPRWLSCVHKDTYGCQDLPILYACLRSGCGWDIWWSLSNGNRTDEKEGASEERLNVSVQNFWHHVVIIKKFRLLNSYFICDESYYRDIHFSRNEIHFSICLIPGF